MLSAHLKAILKRVGSPVLDGLGVYDRRMQQLPAKRWTVVMYHRIIETAAEDPFGLGMCVTRDRFDAQLGYFRRHHSPISMTEALRRLEQGEPLPERALTVTFDDGYLDNLTVALPVLRAHAMDATLFVPTGGIDDQPLWWDRVIRAFDATDATHIEPGELGIPLPDPRMPLGAWQRVRTLARVLDSLWTLPHDRMLEVLGRIELALPPRRSVAPVARRMTSQQVVEMHRAGIEIGAHTVRHSNLKLETPAAVRSEMQTSKQVLEALCDAPVEGFAYPAGWKNADIEAAARESGFRYAVSTVTGVNTADCDRFTIARIGMPDSPVSDLKRALASASLRTGANGAH
jgi:peptidoglycan/xylan/chitin deacetylase (PgdA/CDA1 family)